MMMNNRIEMPFGGLMDEKDLKIKILEGKNFAKGRIRFNSRFSFATAKRSILWYFSAGKILCFERVY